MKSESIDSSIEGSIQSFMIYTIKRLKCISISENCVKFYSKVGDRHLTFPLEKENQFEIGALYSFQMTVNRYMNIKGNIDRYTYGIFSKVA